MRKLIRFSYDEIKEVEKLAGTMPVEMVAAAFDCSKSTLTRHCPNISFNYYFKYVKNSKLVEDVISFFEKNGYKKTEKHFKRFDIRIRSIVERYERSCLLKRKWNWSETLELLKMAGFISRKSQAAFFVNRNLKAQGVQKAWQSKMSQPSRNFHGLPYHKYRHFVRKTDRSLKVCRLKDHKETRKIMLWCDLEKSLKDEVPEFFREYVSAMSKFQKKLYGVENPRMEIKKLIKEREIF